MKFLPLLWAWSLHRPLRNALGLISVAAAFMLYGLALGMAESFYRQAVARAIAVGSDFLIGALAVAAIGMVLILLLAASAMAQAVRLRLAEFGVMKAIGYGHGLILLLVTAQAVCIWLAGAGLGLLAAKLSYPAALLLIPALAVIPALIYTPVMLAVAVLLAVVLGAFSVLPASRILRLDVVKALAGGLRGTSGRADAERSAAPPAIALPSASLALRLAEMTEMHLFRQTLAATRIALSTLRYRLQGARTVVIAVGIVVFVLLGGLSCAEGIRLGLLTSGDPSRVVLSQANERWEEDKLAPQLAELVATAPGVARARDGAALVDGQYRGNFTLIKRNNGNAGTINVAGVGPRWPAMAPEFRLLAGRMPRPGARELIAGEIARRKFSGLDADRVKFLKTEWRIVGTFAASTWWNAYLLGDAATLKAAARQPHDNTILLRLTSPEAFADFRKAVAHRLPPDIRIERETGYYARYWKGITETAAAFGLTYLLASVAAFGATAAMVQVMQVAVEERAREIAVLRALGFDGIAVAVSLTAEAMLLSAVGAATGAAVVWLCFDGNLYNGAGNVFRVTVNLHLLLVAIAWGLVIATVGVARPAFSLARQTAIEAIRQA